MNNATTISHETFAPEFSAWINSASLDDLYSAYSDNHKECHGYRPRWASAYTREEFAQAFVSLGEDFEREAAWEAEQAAHDAWAIEAKVGVPIFADAQPLPYEEYDMVVRKF